MRFCFYVSLSLVVCFTACTAAKKTTVKPAIPITSLRFIDEYIIPPGTTVNGTVVGGLSSIDYDSANGVYYMISDDPGSRSDSRYYTATIQLSEKGIDTVLFTAVTTLLTAAGKPFADIRNDRTHSLDAESMRYNPNTGELIIGSEGQRFYDGKQWLLQNPAVFVHDRNGTFKDSFALPSNMQIYLQEKGLRHNSVFEGMTFADNYQHLYVNIESPIYEDGLPAGTKDSTAWIRINKFDVPTRKLLAQYAYGLDALRYAAQPTGAFQINGMTDMLDLGNDQFLVIERAFSTGHPSSDVRIYLADGSGATDISGVISLATHPPKKYFTKKKLFDFESLHRYIDNIEGVSFGPTLPNGHRTLLFIVDNDFIAERKSQLFLFEVIP